MRDFVENCLTLLKKHNTLLHDYAVQLGNLPESEEKSHVRIDYSIVEEELNDVLEVLLIFNNADTIAEAKANVQHIRSSTTSAELYEFIMAL